MTQKGTAKHPRKHPYRLSPSMRAMLKALPFSDTNDFDDASRGFIGTLKCADRLGAGQGGRGARGGLRLSADSGGSRDGRSKPVAGSRAAT